MKLQMKGLVQKVAEVTLTTGGEKHADGTSAIHTSKSWRMVVWPWHLAFDTGNEKPDFTIGQEVLITVEPVPPTPVDLLSPQTPVIKMDTVDNQ